MEQPDANQLDTLMRLIARHNHLLERQLANDANWKRKFLMAAVAGFGGVLGATVVVSIALALIRPFERIELFKPGVERLLQDLDRKKS